MTRVTKFKRKRRKIHIRLTLKGWLVLAILLVVVIALVISQCSRKQTPAYPSQIGYIPVTTDLLQEGNAGRPGTLRTIKWVVIHETGNKEASATAASHNNYLHNTKRADDTTSWHYTVDETEIYHHLPDNEVGWHAGDGSAPGGGNMSGIGLEICVNKGSSYEQALDNAAQLTAYLLDTYGLKLDAVKQHGDFMQKNCPEQLRQDDNWENFLQKVKAARK